MKQNIIALVLVAGLIAGCGTSWDIGHNRTLDRGGWSIHLHAVPDDAVTQGDTGITVSTGGHTIVINEGVTIDGRQLATGPTGEVTVTQGNGTVSLAINGQKIETN